MAAKKQKYYVVWEGNKPGIYTSWEDCLAQVKAYPNAKYKSYESKSEAETAYSKSYSFTVKADAKPKANVTSDWKNHVPVGSITVDAACSGNPGDMEYRGVDPYTGREIFHQGPFKSGTNNVGEFLAIVHALALFKRNNMPNAAIFTDSKTAMSWVKRKVANTKLEFTFKNHELQILLHRAQLWLNENSYKNPIQKWETESWGEIPADFGRK
ncbi:MAG: ribonuclease H family protein [Saprospiraceae bacterium]|nr:ribonuclease H family protein [Saprospiraceae bacterium]